MKVTCLYGSPRPRSNSTAIARRFGETAAGLGAEIREFHLNRLRYRGCQGCGTCKGRLERCILEDDLSAVLAAVAEADVLVLASPVYYGDVSSQMKGFVDRTYSFLGPDYSNRLAPGKKLVFVLVQAEAEEDHYADIYPRYEAFFRWYGFEDNHLLRLCGVQDPDSVGPDAPVMARAQELARLICGPDRGKQSS